MLIKNKMANSESMDISTDVDGDAEIDDVVAVGKNVDEFLKTFRRSMPRRSSLFNISQELQDTQFRHIKNEECASYEQQLQHEVKEWDTIWRSTLAHLEKSKTPNSPLNISILSKEQLDYLAAAPNLRLYLSESLDLHEKYAIWRKEYAQVSVAQKNVQEMSKYQIQQAKNVLMAEQLANVKMN